MLNVLLTLCSPSSCRRGSEVGRLPAGRAPFRGLLHPARALLAGSKRDVLQRREHAHGHDDEVEQGEDRERSLDHRLEEYPVREDAVVNGEVRVAEVSAALDGGDARRDESRHECVHVVLQARAEHHADGHGHRLRT